MNYIYDINVQKGRLATGSTVLASKLRSVKLPSPPRRPVAYLASHTTSAGLFPGGKAAGVWR